MPKKKKETITPAAEKKEEAVEEKESTKKSPSPISIHVAQNPTHELAQMGTDSLKELIEKNIKWSQVIYEQNRKLKRRLTWMAIGSYLRLAILVVPIILGIIYLPAILEDVMGQYQSILGATGAAGNLDPKLIEEAFKLFQP